MLFTYAYVPHPMEKMQEFIEFIFFEVWCKAPGGPPYSLDLFEEAHELKTVMEAFHYSDAKGADFFNGHVERIYGLFADLSLQQIDQLQVWFRGNNDIAGLCRNDPAVSIARYGDLQAFNLPLAKELASFFKGLYNPKDLLGLKALRDVIGEIDDHHIQFTTVNRKGKCPFCGINDVKGVYHSRREAYDHYLPKGKYPFNSINFHNLAPACHECNSTYKLSKDPLYDAKDPLLTKTGGRRKSFYPYQNTSPIIDVKITLNTNDWTGITPDEVNITIGPVTLREEIDTWMDVYGIIERYKGKCCGENDGKGWIVEVFDEWKEDGRDPEDYLKTLARQAKARPYTSDNFLKHPFLNACHDAGLFRVPV